MKHSVFSTSVCLGAALTLLFCTQGLASDADTAAPTVTVRLGRLELNARATGAIAWSSLIPVLSPMNGRIDALHVAEGQAVARHGRAAWISSPQRALLLDHVQGQNLAELEKWEQVYQPVPVLAPSDGTVIKISVTPGQNVGALQPLFTLGDHWVARLYLEETDIPVVTPGGSAALTLYALPGVMLTGTVTRIATQAQLYRNAVAYEVDVTVPTWPAAAKAGMSLNATFAAPVRDETLLAPRTAVFRHEGQESVYRLDPDGMPEVQPVRTGRSAEIEVEILEGLQAGDLVCVDAALQHAADQAAAKPRRSPLLPFTRGR